MIIRSYFNLYAKYISDEIGYGVFSEDFIPSGSVVETSYCIPVNPNMEWDEYKFGDIDKNTYLPLGFASIYNHSDTPNLGREFIDNKIIQFYSIKNIKIGEQLCHSYGNSYWKYRNDKKKII
jgi:hypothetical protein